MARLSYADSVSALKQRSIIGAEEHPAPLSRMPSLEDDTEGLNFFRTLVEGDLSSLTIPRTLVCRSEVRDCRFVDTDLSESFLCWNDFIDVDFSAASLRGADLRASTYVRVRFCGADLTGADLRRTSYEDCDFTGAVMTGAKATRTLFDGLKLSREQKAQITWSMLPGDEPPGG